jgi:hypothetical protein
MPDKTLEAMLTIANTLTADDPDCVRGSATAAVMESPNEGRGVVAPSVQAAAGRTRMDEDMESQESSPSSHIPPASQPAGYRRGAPTSVTAASAGEYERQRTRESKVSTTCLGKPREPHAWWPIGTHLVGRIGSEEFNAIVVANPQVKSGCSLQIRSGAAAGRVCISVVSNGEPAIVASGFQMSRNTWLE